MFSIPSIQQASVVLNELNKISPLMGLLHSVNEAEYWLADHRRDLPDKITVCMGVSRIVIIHDDWDYVLKINLFDDNIDYNRIEAERYLNIETDELRAVFAQTFLLFNYRLDNGLIIPIYAQEKCATVNEDETFECHCSEWSIVQLPDVYDYDNESMRILEALRAWLPQSTRKQFDNFLCEYNICDLHCGNWGINKNGNLVVIDYAWY